MFFSVFLQKTNYSKVSYTVLELVLSISIGLIVLSLAYSFFIIQKNIELKHKNKIEMRQEIRAAFYIMEREIKLAGLNVLENDDIGIKKALSNLIEFSTDLNEDGRTISPNEEISFAFASKYDTNNDGIADNNFAPIGRKTGNGYFQTLINNIQAIFFAYSYKNKKGETALNSSGNAIWGYDSDGDGLLDNRIDSNNNDIADLNDIVGGVALSETIKIENINGVKVYLLSIYGKNDFKKKYQYMLGDKLIKGEDKYKRIMCSFVVKIRN